MISLLRQLVYYYTIAILLRIILSWFPIGPGPMAKVYEFLVRITEPLLGPIRRIMPRAGGLDFSPMIAILFLQVVVLGVLLR